MTRDRHSSLLLSIIVATLVVYGFLVLHRDRSLLVSYRDVPDQVRRAILKVQEGDRVTNVEIEADRGKTVYEFTLEDRGGLRWYVTFDADGREIASHGEDVD